MMTTKDFRIATVIRFIGVLFLFAFFYFSLNAKDTLGDALVLCGFLLFSFYFIFVLPDKILLGDLLVNTHKRKQKGGGE